MERDTAVDMSRARQRPEPVLIIGGRGEFGQFLQHDVLPRLGVRGILSTDRDTPRDAYLNRLGRARHIVLSTPLAGYAELACQVVDACGSAERPITFWLIPSVQAGVWRAVSATLTRLGNPHLSAVFAHPMYGPNGFRSTEAEARTFRNILTATQEGGAHPVSRDVARVGGAFRRHLNIETVDDFTPDEHDRITASSQGLTYCVGRFMLEQPALGAAVERHLPELYGAFLANRELINDFLRLNPHMARVSEAFAAAWAQTSRATYRDLLLAFARADAVLNHGRLPVISTKWYEKLRAASRS
jgi:hypothetical protein